MTWRSNLKLFTGLIAVLVLVLGLTVIFTQRQSQVTSVSASIEAERYPVGIDYGGTLVKSFITGPNQRVNKGDVLFTLQSPSLQADLAKGLLKPETIAYTVTNDGTITLTAAVSGTVQDATTKPGSFVQAGQVIATIEKVGSLSVVAKYELTGRDYSRVGNGAAVKVLLPNGASVDGTVSTIDVKTVGGQAETTIRVTSTALTDGAFNGLMKAGTPVTATLKLRDDGILAGAYDGFANFLRKIGL